MNSKLLTESGWKTNVQKFKIKDNGLLRALATYEKTKDHEHDELIKTIALMNQLAANLKKAKEVAAEAAAVKYLNDLIDALESEQREIAKDKALAEKTEAMTQKKADAEAKKREKEEGEEDEEEEEDDEEEEEEEEGEGAYAVRLMSALQKLKGAKDLSYYFIVCDAKPHCGFMVAKRITPKHKQELTTVTGGSKRFFPVGTCQFEDGRFVFNLEKPVAGLARKLQDSLKYFTGKKLPIKVGAETAEDDEGQSDAPQSKEKRPTIAPPKLGKAVLAKAPEVWHQTRQILTTNIGHLKGAIQDEYAEEAPELIAEIEQNLKKLDALLSTLDHKLADSLAKAHAAEDAAARAAELKNAKTILTNYIKYVKSEPLIAHIDANPFGVDTNLKKVLTDSLMHMAQAIG